MDEATLTQLLESASGANTASLFDLDALIQALAPFMIAMTALSILLVALYIVSIISKWRANRAIIDIKKLLIQMNERDKSREARNTLADLPQQPAPDSPAHP
jgi:ATP/ADP translocase